MSLSSGSPPADIIHSDLACSTQLVDKCRLACMCVCVPRVPTCQGTAVSRMICRLRGYRRRTGTWCVSWAAAPLRLSLSRAQSATWSSSSCLHMQGMLPGLPLTKRCVLALHDLQNASICSECFSAMLIDVIAGVVMHDAGVHIALLLMFQCTGA